LYRKSTCQKLLKRFAIRGGFVGHAAP
jgi:hypothetical protein